MGHAATDKNIIFYEINTCKIKTSTHIVFDDANFTVPAAQHSVTSQLLIDLRYLQNDYEPSTISSGPILTNTAKVQLLSPLAVLPTLGSSHAAGYDVVSTLATTLQPATVTEIPLDLSIEPPTGTYIHIAPRSGLALRGILVYGGIIDADYHGNIAVLLFNSSNRQWIFLLGKRLHNLSLNHILL